MKRAATIGPSPPNSPLSLRSATALTQRRRPHRSGSAEAAQLRAGERAVGGVAGLGGEQGAARRHPARGGGAHQEEDPAPRRVGRALRRQRLRADLEEWGAHRVAHDRRCGQGGA